MLFVEIVFGVLALIVGGAAFVGLFTAFLLSVFGMIGKKAQAN